jgi:adenylate kinase family enzyme
LQNTKFKRLNIHKKQSDSLFSLCEGPILFCKVDTQTPLEEVFRKLVVNE